VITVCCLWSCSDGRVLSSSWDATARVWQGQNQVALLEGHQASVWAVTELPESKKIITASADKTIKVWSHDVCEQTLKGW
jgi:phospholipase A-2-activating protein